MIIKTTLTGLGEKIKSGGEVYFRFCDKPDEWNFYNGDDEFMVAKLVEFCGYDVILTGWNGGELYYAEGTCADDVEDITETVVNIIMEHFYTPDKNVDVEIYIGVETE